MTKIEWANQTWNPVVGCSRVSPGCDNCYMFALFPRLKAMRVPGYEEGPEQVRMMPKRLSEPYKWRKPRMVFVNSMSDLFHSRVPFEFITQVFDAMCASPQHTYQILTKRPGRVDAWWKMHAGRYGWKWPAHVWIGTSVESQKYAPRVKVLERVPAPIRFVSAEPLLGPLDLSAYLDLDAVQWVIVGGESGHKARPMAIEWAQSLRDQCARHGVPFFLKQLGGRRDKRGGEKATLRSDGPLYHQMPTPGYSCDSLPRLPGVVPS